MIRKQRAQTKQPDHDSDPVGSDHDRANNAEHEYQSAAPGHGIAVKG
jgi:hypothetical protein